MRMITACFARALKGWTSRICVHFLLTFQEVMPISKTRNQLRFRYQRVARAPTVSRVSTGVSQLRDFLDVRDRSARPACLGEEVERHVLVVADRREGLIHIRPRIWIARYGHLP